MRFCLLQQWCSSFHSLTLCPNIPRTPHTPTGAADALLFCLLQQWCDNFDSLSSSRARKLCAMALCRLLALPSPAILQHLDSLLVCITGGCC